MTTTTTIHTIRLFSQDFRQALASALLYAPKPGTWAVPEGMSHICLHIEDGDTRLSVNALDNHGFYRHLLPLFRDTDRDGQEIGPVPSLPDGCFAWKDRGQLLLPLDAVATMLKMIPKRAVRPLTLEVTHTPTTPTEKGGQEVRFIGPDGTTYTFSTKLLDFPDYSLFLSRALANKDALNVPQVRSFPAKEFVRIGKALPDKEFFYTYWGPKTGSPCLIEYGQDITIVYMPGKLPPEMATEDAAAAA
jgi:hypothetical protein